MRAFALVCAMASACSAPAASLGRPDAVAPQPRDADEGTGAGDAGDAGDAGVHGHDFAFVANYVAGISAFAIQPDGALRQLQATPFEPARHFFGIASHPSLPVVYAAEYTGHAVDAYRIDPDTGALSLLGQPVAIDHAAISIAVDPEGRFVYVGDFDDINLATFSIHTFAIDADGVLSAQPVASLVRPNEADAIAPARSGNVVYTTGSGAGIRAYAVDPAGTLTELTDSPFAATTSGGGWLAFHPTHDIVYETRRALAAFAAEPSTGALTALDGSPFGAGANADPGQRALAIDPRGRFACVVDSPAGTLTVHALHADGSIAMQGVTYDAGTFAYSVAIDPDGRFVYVATDIGNLAAFSVDPQSLALTPVGEPMVSVVGNAPEMLVLRLGS